MREREREEVNSSERKRSIFWMTHTMEKKEGGDRGDSNRQTRRKDGA